MLTLDNPSIDKLTDSIEFSQYIELYSLQHGVSLIESILQYCEDADADPEECIPLVSRSLKEKIEEEAIKEKMLVTKTTRGLPFLIK